MQEGAASRTADRVAERRAAHQLLDVPPIFVDPFAIRLLRPEVAARLREAPEEVDRSPIAKYLRAFFAVRSRYAEDVLRDAVRRGVVQYVLVGAGFDTFALRNSDPNLNVFEVDHPATQAEKRQRIEAAGLAPKVEFVAADLSMISLRAALANSSFDPKKPAVFAWLGVIPYLEQDAVETTLRDIRSFGEGSAVAFDYGLPREALSFVGRVVFDRMAARVAAIGEPWKTFFTPERLRRLLQDVGFSTIEDLDAAAINARYFANRRDDLRVGEAAHLAAATV